MLSIMANRSDKRGRRKITALDSFGYQRKIKKIRRNKLKRQAEVAQRRFNFVPNCLAPFDQQCSGEKTCSSSFQASSAFSLRYFNLSKGAQSVNSGYIFNSPSRFFLMPDTKCKVLEYIQTEVERR